MTSRGHALGDAAETALQADCRCLGPQLGAEMHRSRSSDSWGRKIAALAEAQECLLPMEAQSRRDGHHEA